MRQYVRNRRHGAECNHEIDDKARMFTAEMGHEIHSCQMDAASPLIQDCWVAFCVSVEAWLQNLGSCWQSEPRAF